MLGSLEIEKEGSDERYAVQSREDHRDFEGGRLQDEHDWGGQFVSSDFLPSAEILIFYLLILRKPCIL